MKRIILLLLLIYLFQGGHAQLVHGTVHVKSDSSGYFDGSNVRVIGQMAKQRIGDLLPYDYKLK
jgi:hypothetical protein